MKNSQSNSNVIACVLLLLSTAGTMYGQSASSRAPLQSEADEYTRYELLAPESSSFAIHYEVTATTAGAKYFFNPIREGSVASGESVIDVATGRPLEFQVVSGDEAVKDPLMQGEDKSVDYIKVTLARPVPQEGQARLLILKTYKDAKSYYREGDEIVFNRPLSIPRNSVVLPAGYEVVSCNIPSQILAEPDGRIAISFMNGSGAEAPLIVKGKRGAQTGAMAAPRAPGSAKSWEAPFEGDTEAERLSERAHQDREIVYFLLQPETHAFRLYHDYTESRPGVDKYFNVVRSGSKVSDPSAYILDTGEKLTTKIMTGAELAAAKIDAGEPVDAAAQVVAVPFPPVKVGQNTRLRISETYTAPASYRLEGDTLVFDRSLGRPRNAVVLPEGWYSTASSIPATVSQMADGRIRLDFWNGSPEAADALIKAKRRATEAAAPVSSSARPADHVYRNGVIFTADIGNKTAEAVAIRDGRIVYVGGNQGVAPFIGAGTVTTELNGRFLMPGLVDGHMHPLEAGNKLLKCSLNYESLTIAEMQKRIQACLDHSAAADANVWLEVVNWFQENMRPAGVRTSRATLDALKTNRPILVISSFGHTALANTHALQLARITAKTPDPVGGKIWRDDHGEPTGLLEDAGYAVFSDLLPKPTEKENAAAATAALKEMSRQGVTSFLDAAAPPESMSAFAGLQRAGGLTARAHFAPVIEPKEAGDLPGAIARVVAFAKQYDEGAIQPGPGITVRNAKLFLDGVIAAPALTGAMREPYFKNAGTAEKPNWVPGSSRGPAVYFSSEALAAVLVDLGRAGIDPHMHADGDGAVHAALDGIEALRTALPTADIRPAIAHDEIVDPADFARFKPLGAIPVLSLQWEKPAGDTLGLTNYFGPARKKILEPSGLLAAAGARIAFGSDWPVDPLNEWFALKVGVTRTNAPDAPSEYRGRLGDDPGLSREAVLRAATIDAAYELHEDQATGSIEVGKFADLIVLDRNPLEVPAEEIAKIKVLKTVVGGNVVYENSRDTN
jgi:predicted amidohydrolase YtcJ